MVFGHHPTIASMPWLETLLDPDSNIVFVLSSFPSAHEMIETLIRALCIDGRVQEVLHHTGTFSQGVLGTFMRAIMRSMGVNNVHFVMVDVLG